MRAMTLILGSASPRRQAILNALGLRFMTHASDAPEIEEPHDPIRTVTANALAKFRVCRARYPEAALITADTLVWFQGRLVGKPADRAEAAAFLRGFSDQIQVVYTGLTLGMPGQDPETRVEASSVRFKPLSDAIIEAYLDRARPYDRAGAYDIDESGDLLIASISGSYTNVMGLPLEPVRDWLVARGLLAADATPSRVFGWGGR